MISEATSIISRMFPPDFLIKETDGVLEIRDSNADSGRGYRIILEMEARFIQAKLEFENFAGQLVAFAEKQLELEKDILKTLSLKYPRLSGRIVRQSIEDIAEPETRKSDAWWLTFQYRLSDSPEDDFLAFADVLLCFLLLLFPYETEGETEGQTIEEISRRYERNRLNRALCLAFHGYNCKACGVNLRQLYKGLQDELIHVHHLTPLSLAGESKPDPIRDLVPLCPNCHNVAHRRNPPFTIEEIKNMIQ